MSYRLLIEPAALKELGKLPPDLRRRLSDRIDRLAENPRPASSEQLTGDLEGLRKDRMGHYRVVYEIAEAVQTVTVWGVGHRRFIYDKVVRRRRRRSGLART